MSLDERARVGIRPRYSAGVTVVLVVALLSGCTSELPDQQAAAAPADAPTSPVDAPTSPVVASASPPSSAELASSAEMAVRGAREDLAEPVMDLAGSTVDIARRVDFIRHEVNRGPARRQAIAEVDVLAEALEDDASAVEQMTADMDGALRPARRAVEALVALSLTVAADVAAEMAALQPILDIDDDLSAVVDGWDDPASRSEAPEQFGDLVAEAEAVRSAAHMLPAPPDGCEGPRANRIRWAELVVQRTTQLRDAAVAADGPAFDQLFAAFADQPYGEDPVVADAASRDCWLQHSSLPDVGGLVDERLAAVEDALSSP